MTGVLNKKSICFTLSITRDFSDKGFYMWNIRLYWNGGMDRFKVFPWNKVGTLWPNTPYALWWVKWGCYMGMRGLWEVVLSKSGLLHRNQEKGWYFASGFPRGVWDNTLDSRSRGVQRRGLSAGSLQTSAEDIGLDPSLWTWRSSVLLPPGSRARESQLTSGS